MLINFIAKDHHPPLSIIYQDSWIIAFHKPPGLLIHPTHKNEKDTLVTHCSQFLWIGENEQKESINPGIVHRLDRETEGIILVGRTAESADILRQSFKNRTVKKTYLALCRGRAPAPIGLVDQPIKRHPSRRNSFTIDKNGRPAQTAYELLNSIEDRWSLLRLKPITGRSHQIRVHLKYLSIPLAHDPLYNPCPAISSYGMPLLAWTVQLPHPITKSSLKLQTHIPQRFQSLWAKLRKQPTL